MTTKPKTAAATVASDDHLTDHEWRLKMAAEGRASYVPGKSAEEVEASITASRGRNVMVNLEISEEERNELEVAASEIEYTLASAANVFSLLHTGLTCGFLDGGNNDVHSVLELCKRGMQHAEEREGRVLTKFGGTLREQSSKAKGGAA